MRDNEERGRVKGGGWTLFGGCVCASVSVLLQIALLLYLRGVHDVFAV